MRASSSSPRACSGDMYATVPTGVPGVVVSRSAPIVDVVVRPSRGADAATLHQPEIEDLRLAALVTKMFAGLMSRWTMP